MDAPLALIAEAGADDSVAIVGPGLGAELGRRLGVNEPPDNA
jgi:hypothetical protein